MTLGDVLTIDRDWLPVKRDISALWVALLSEGASMGWADKAVERRIRSEGLLQPDDRLVAIEVGDVLTWRSKGQHRSASRTYMAIGYGTRRLAIVADDGYYYTDAWLYTGTNGAAVPHC